MGYAGGLEVASYARASLTRASFIGARSGLDGGSVFLWKRSELNVTDSIVSGSSVGYGGSGAGIAGAPDRQIESQGPGACV